MKKILAAFAAAAITLTMSGCVSTKTSNAMAEYDFKSMNTDFIQLKEPNEGDTIAIIDTDYGEIRAVLYENYAPNTCAAFIKHAQNGDYDNKLVYGVIKDCYFITGGEENERGIYIGRENDDELIANECTPDLWPFTGALLSYSEKTGFGDARWIMCASDRENVTEDAINQLKETVADREDETEREKLLTMFDTFYEVGGVFGAAGYTTVFGQTYQGQDVIEKLCAITPDENGRASEDVYIRSVTISKYTTEGTNE